jgi:hypothetical protein
MLSGYLNAAMPYSNKSYSGKFIPKNRQKYVGDPNNIIYRSSWELKFMKYCDDTKSVIQWGSEELIIPYYSPVDKKVRRYYPDFYMKVISSNGEIKKYLIEIKPERFTQPPKQPKRKTKSYLSEVNQYITNLSKWEAAREFCSDHNWEFLVITEKHLKI